MERHGRQCRIALRQAAANGCQHSLPMHIRSHGRSWSGASCAMANCAQCRTFLESTESYPGSEHCCGVAQNNKQACPAVSTKTSATLHHVEHRSSEVPSVWHMGGASAEPQCSTALTACRITCCPVMPSSDSRRDCFSSTKGPPAPTSHPAVSTPQSYAKCLAEAPFDSRTSNGAHRYLPDVVQ